MNKTPQMRITAHNTRTVYLERRIQAAVHGESFRDFSAIIGWKGLEDSVEMYGKDHEFTKLITDLKGKDPDDAFSQIPYEKGFTFLYYLEKLVGKDKWDTFIPHVREHCVLQDPASTD